MTPFDDLVTIMALYLVSETDVKTSVVKKLFYTLTPYKPLLFIIVYYSTETATHSNTNIQNHLTQNIKTVQRSKFRYKYNLGYNFYVSHLMAERLSSFVCSAIQLALHNTFSRILRARFTKL